MKILRNVCLAPVLAAFFAFAHPAYSHDVWVESNTAIFRTGDVAHLSLKLGNHGNDHRDYKLASKVAPELRSLRILTPDGKEVDLTSQLIDTGYTPAEGFWSARFVNNLPGLYTAVSTTDSVMTYAPERAVRSAKTYFLVSRSLDRVPLPKPVAGKPLSNGLELVPETHPVAPLGPGTKVTVRLYLQGKPLPGVKVSFIPEGAILKEGLDSRYEAMTNVNGRASFTPTEASRYLVVAHHRTPESGKDKSGATYSATKFSATLCLYVPAICPCCG